jgi:hypothetical protein
MKGFVITITLLLSLSSCTYKYDVVKWDNSVLLGTIVGTLISLTR